MQARDFQTPADGTRLRVLAIDGGGVRGLIPALVLERLEQMLEERRPGMRISDAFDLIAGTSVGGLIGLALAAPDGSGRPRLSAAEITGLFSEPVLRKIFSRDGLGRLGPLRGVADLLDPRYGLDGLYEAMVEYVGEATLDRATTDLLVSSYDMDEREPRFFKRWGRRAGEVSFADAGLATSAAPTYFPAYSIGEAALVDGGIFANNPAIAAIVEGLKRTDGEPLVPSDLMVLSIGTGHHESGFDAAEVSEWGQLGWVLPKDGEPPLIGAMLDGQSDATDHWAHVLLNHSPGDQLADSERIGSGPRYFRLQAELPRTIPLDGTSSDELELLAGCAAELIAAREGELAAIADAATAG